MTLRLVRTTQPRRSASSTITTRTIAASATYTHGLLEAISGSLDELIDPEASRVILQSAITALEALNHLGVDIPNLKSLEERAVEVLNKKPDKLLRQKPGNPPAGGRANHSTK